MKCYFLGTHSYEALMNQKLIKIYQVSNFNEIG